jgi:hypothetical protein
MKMWKPQPLTTLWASTASKGITLPLLGCRNTNLHPAKDIAINPRFLHYAVKGRYLLWSERLTKESNHLPQQNLEIIGLIQFL